jgi:predicted ATPase
MRPAGNDALISTMFVPPGTRVDRYEVIRALGSGGMGHVYLCRDTRLDRMVAVKLLDRQIAQDPHLRGRFDREARALIALNHPHVLTLFDVGEIGGTPYLVSEVVEGLDLRRLMDQGEVQVDEALRIVEQVASGLSAAHAAGIVHRDVKPENVMVRPDGYVKVLDFGVAKLQSFASRDEAGADRPGTAAQTLVGTVRYMSPEQVRGEAVDRRSDVWSLGVVLYELVAQRLPFTGRTPADVIAAVLGAALLPVSDAAPGRAPRALDAILARALQRDPAQRYGSCDELRADLHALRLSLATRGPDATVTEATRVAAPGSTTANESGSWGAIAMAAREAQGSGESRPRHNLPAVTSTFVGREAEVAAVTRLLRRPEVRLVVLTGPGGAGKTRLAVEAARALVDDFPDGVWVVPLAPLRDPDEVPAAIAAALGVKELGDRSPLEAVEAALRQRRLLLVLDNFEHLMGAAGAVARLLERGPHVEVLVTSREVLRLTGEHAYPVPPLGLPPPAETPSLAELARCPSVALFLARARAHVPGFRLDAGNAAAIAELCRRLDGLPLAIELAAARVRVLTPAAMLKRLADRFRLLTAGAADLPERHRTLRSTLDWGYELLGATERRLLPRLAVFRGPFALSAVEEVCGDGVADVLDPLQSLVDKSFVQSLPSAHGEPRFALLETVREYGRERLDAAELLALRERHLDCFLARAEAAAPETAPAGDATATEELVHSEQELRAALEHALALPEPARALRLTGALWWSWYLRGQYREGRRWSEAALARAGDERSVARARTLLGAGVLAFLQCDYAAAEERLGQARALAAELGALAVLASSLQFSGSVARERGDYERAIALHEESLGLWRELGELCGEGRSLNYLAFVAWLRGDVEAARRFAADTLERFRALGDLDGIVWSLMNRAGTLLCAGDLAAARTAAHEALTSSSAAEFKEGIAWALDLLGRLAVREAHPGRGQMLLQRSLRLHRELGDRWRMASVLEALSTVARVRGALERAARLEGGAIALRERLGTPRPPAEQPDWERGRDEARAALGEAEWDERARHGAQLDLERLVAYALEVEGSAEVSARES